jgi:energy-coupling factor transport system substrate-specific component
MKYYKEFQCHIENGGLMVDRRLNVKDLINIGVFTAIYFVLSFSCGMVGFIPVFMVVLPFMISVVTGIPFMLFLTKVTKFGMLTIMGTIIGLLMLALGHGWPMIVSGIGCGLIADLIMKLGEYKNWLKTLIGYCIFSEWSIGAMLPIWIMRDSYFARARAGYGEEYSNALMALMADWVFPVMIVSVIVGGISGAYLGRAILKKHFKRAGLA